MKMKLWSNALALASLVYLLHATVVTAQENIAASPNGKNWASYNGDYSGQRYSSLSGINTTNISHLRAAWIFHAENTSRLEVTPVVYNGAMYVTASNTVSALDARTGRE